MALIIVALAAHGYTHQAGAHGFVAVGHKAHAHRIACRHQLPDKFCRLGIVANDAVVVLVRIYVVEFNGLGREFAWRKGVEE